MKKKILYILTKSNWGGAQRYVFDLITSIPDEEFEKHILFGKSGEASGLDARIKEISKTRNISFSYLPHFQRDIDLLKEARSVLFLYRFLKRERPDIVHLNSSKAGGLGALAARCAGVPTIIFTAHGWPWKETHRPLWWRAVALIGSYLTALLAHHVVTLHERDLHDFDAWPLAKAKIVKIYNGVRDAAGYTKDEARGELAKKYGVPDNVPIIGTVGELHANKGYSYLLEAFAALPKRVSLVIIGSGEEQKALEAQARSLRIRKRVFFTGFLPGPDYMRAFDLFVLPSVKEGFPFVILEAGARGIPVIATAVGGVPEVVRTGDTGLLVSPKEPEELAQAMRLLLEDPEVAARYASALAQKIRQEFRFEAETLPKTLALYRS